MVRRSLALAAAVLAVSVSTACSGDDDPQPSSPTDDPTTGAPATTDSPESPESTVTGFYADLAAGDVVAACDWWTPRYAAASVDAWNEGDYGRRVLSCPDLLSAISDVLAIVGDPAEQLEVTDLTSEAVDATHARVDVTLAAADDEPETYLLTLTDEGWRISGDEAGELAPGSSPSRG